jgi:hypothetical protein
MLDFSINNIFGQFVGRLAIPMGTTCAPMLTDLFLQYYEADFFQGLFSINERKLTNVFIPNFRY